MFVHLSLLSVLIRVPQDGIPSALCTMQLVCLRLHFTKIPRYLDLGEDEYGPVYVPVVLEDLQDIYNAGAETRRRLPPVQFADGIPTLRYVAVAEEEPSWAVEDQKRNRESADDRYGGEADEYEFQDEWYTEKIKTLQRWRVERSFEEGQMKTELHPLTPGKGKEVQAFLEKADLESIEPIDGEF